MGSIIDLNQTNRQYEIVLCGLQGEYITTLRSYKTFARGQICSPKMTIRDDGTQSLTFNVPMKYVPEGENWENGELIDNPFYYTFKNGTLLINTRTIKVMVNRDNTEKVFPFLITNIVEARNGRELMCSVQAEGLAFNELGKIGYELSLTADLVELEYDKYRYKIFTEKDGDQCYYYTNKECSSGQAAITLPHLVQILEETHGGSTTKYYYFIGDGIDGTVGTNYYVPAAQITDFEITPTIEYWLDKVFPNIKDDNGKVIKWLTPWCYELRMDWSNYTDTDRLSTKIYEDVYTTTWITQDGNIVPSDISSQQEKARYISCEKSNKYNITQTLAETFGVFCNYEYKYDSAHNIQKEYVEDNMLWAGKKCVFYNIFENTSQGDEQLVSIDYQKNLNAIQRTSDTTDIITKMYVSETESDTMTNGYISIADTEINPTYENYILNFDYLYSIGAIDEYQHDYINTYNVSMRTHNLQLIEYAKIINDLQQKQNELEAHLTSLQEQANSAQETKTEYEARATYQDIPAITRTAINPVSLIFIKNSATGNYVATIGLEGVEPTSLKLYSSYECTTAQEIFRYGDNPSATGIYLDYDTDFDDQRYLIGAHAAANAPIFSVGQPLENTKQVWACLTYLPENKYQAIISNMNDILSQKEIEITEAENQLASIKTQVMAASSNQEAERQNKEKEVQHFNNIMGPALKEGSWQKDDYVDPGQRYTDIVKAPNIEDNFTKFLWDEISFEGEQLNYYFATLQDQQATPQVKSYYPYFNLSSIYNSINGYEKNIKIELYYSSYSYTVGTNGLAAGKYYFTINGIKQYYFETTSAISAGTVLSYNPALKTFTIGSTQTTYYIIKPVSWADASIINLTSFFSHSGANGMVSLSIDAGLAYSFLKNGSTISPIIICTRSDLAMGANGLNVARILYAAIDTTITINYTYPSNSNIVYPRIVINKDNVNTTNAVFSIEADAASNAASPTKALENYNDYSILQRELHPYITLYPTNQNTLVTILSWYYYTTFQVSRANEMLYLDAIEVAKENSQPRVSYDISVANLPELVNAKLEIGQVVSITDHEMKLFHTYGYVSEYTLDLDNPMEDNIVIANYKTRFEDLFQMITASSEAMKQKEVSYDRASSAFDGGGVIKGDVFQQSINNNDLSFNFSESNVSINNTNGILVQNKTPYANGIYGAVAIRGGGIFCADTMDENGNYVWHTGITPRGINASLINAGQINTNKIKIFSGSDLAFQWNSEGLYSYAKDSNGIITNTSYIRLSGEGLNFIKDTSPVLSLGWAGLRMYGADNYLELTSENGLSMFGYDVNSQSKKKILQLGKFEEESSYLYGFRLFDYAGNQTLTADSNGKLWLKDTLLVGSDNRTVGIFGGIEEDTDETTVRFWAGNEDNLIAPYRVLQNGTLIASNAQIAGIITANSGKIGGWSIAETQLFSGNMSLSSKTATTDEPNPIRVNVNNAFIVKDNGEINASSATISGTITTNSGLIGGWIIENGAIKSGNLILSSSAEGVNPVRISAGDNFQLFNNGLLSAKNVELTGAIFALGGRIGAWNIDNLGLTTDDGQVGLYTGSSVYHTNSTSPLRIWAGKNNNSYPFAVTADGTLFANKANIEGDIVAINGRIKNKMLVGDAGTGIIIYGGEGEKYIGSSKYSSGTFGYGWRLNENGSADFSNINVRGKISSSVFEYKKVSSIGGSLYVSPTLYLDVASSTITLSNSEYYFTWEMNKSLEEVSGKKWTTGDIVKIEGETVRSDGSYGAKISNIEGVVTNQTTTTKIQVRVSASQFSSSINSFSFIPGALIIFIGNGNKKNGIYLSSVDEGAPFIDVFESDTTSTTVIPAVRLGNLSGIIDNEYFGGQLQGYGLYSSNAFLRGQLVLPGAGITNQTNISYNGSPIRIWAGLTGGQTDITKSNFIVTEDGSMYANQGVFKGTVIATDGTFSGSIRAAGIVIDKKDTINWSPSPSSDHFFVAYNSNPISFNDYVLNIGSHGLSIWEGGLRAYSDFASGWRNGVLPSIPTVDSIYGYSTTNSQPMPYLYLVDDGVDSSYRLDARMVSYKGHFQTISKNANNKYDTKSIIFDNGVWLNNLTDQANLNEVEKTAFNSAREQGMQLKNSKLRLYSSTGILLETPKSVYINATGQEQIDNTSSALFVRGGLSLARGETNAGVTIESVRIEEAFINENSVGLNFIVE